MKKTKKTRLAAAGWRTGDAADFLELSEEEAAFVEMKLSLAANLKKRRKARKLTQGGLAKLLTTSQSRVAKMEAAESDVSIDLLMRSLLTLGATQRDVARIIGSSSRHAA